MQLVTKSIQSNWRILSFTSKFRNVLIKQLEQHQPFRFFLIGYVTLYQCTYLSKRFDELQKY